MFSNVTQVHYFDTKNIWKTCAMSGHLYTAPGIISLSPLSLAIDVTDVTDVALGTTGFWLATRSGAGGTDTLA